MPLRRRTSIAVSLRFLAQKYALVWVVAASVTLVSFAQSHQQQISQVRARVTDAVLPVAAIVHAPLNAVHHVSQTISEWRALHDTNANLQRENAELHNWRQEAQRLIIENARLRALLKTTATPAAQALTARVITASGGSFEHSLLAQAGIDDGIEVGSVVMGAHGVVGRVTEVGNKAARVLLINDENSRIPVQLESSGERAIATGSGKGDLMLNYLNDDVTPTAGERVITSGHGGIFPAGLPVGEIVADGNGWRVKPIEPLTAQDFVRIIDYRVSTDTGKTD